MPGWTLLDNYLAIIAALDIILVAAMVSTVFYIKRTLMAAAARAEPPRQRVQRIAAHGQRLRERFATSGPEMAPRLRRAARAFQRIGVRARVLVEETRAARQEAAAVGASSTVRAARAAQSWSARLFGVWLAARVASAASDEPDPTTEDSAGEDIPGGLGYNR